MINQYRRWTYGTNDDRFPGVLTAVRTRLRNTHPDHVITRDIRSHIPGKRACPELRDTELPKSSLTQGLFLADDDDSVFIIRTPVKGHWSGLDTGLKSHARMELSLGSVQSNLQGNFIQPSYSELDYALYR